MTVAVLVGEDMPVTEMPSVEEASPRLWARVASRETTAAASAPFAVCIVATISTLAACKLTETAASETPAAVARAALKV